MRGNWLCGDDFAASYDTLSEAYDSNWLVHLKPVTARVIEHLPKKISHAKIIDLGCGTGFTTSELERKFPKNKIEAVDISSGMLKQAAGCCSRAKMIEADILEYMLEQENNSAALVFSGWAIGYSRPDRIIRECARVLMPGGTFAFVVNYADTLEPVFYAFRRCMNKFPRQVRKALWPSFPKNWNQVSNFLDKAGFAVEWREEDRIVVPEQRNAKGEILPWLLNTGILAGFDTVLPLHDNKEIAAYFEEEYNRCGKPLNHHYIAAGARLK